MKNNINIPNIKKDLFYFNEYLNCIENYDLIHLFRSSSNYKENFFSDRDILENWKYVVNDIHEWKNKSKMQIYIHIPYCQEFCDFCVYYKQLLVKNIKKTTDLYIDYLIEKFKFYSPVFKGIKFKSLSVWGWTPSILTTSQIKRLFTVFFECFEFENWSYKWIEFRPSSTSEDKLLMLKKIWFETIHFWVQSLDSEVLSLMNRGIDSKDKVIDSINAVKKNKFDNLIIHLIRWLKSDNINKFIFTIDTLIKNNVNEIKIYWLITTSKYLKTHYCNDSKNTYYNKNFNEFSIKLLKKLKNKFLNDSDYGFYYENWIFDHSWSINSFPNAFLDNSLVYFHPTNFSKDFALSNIICPISPPYPCPSYNFPSIIIPPPTPVPIVNTIKFFFLTPNFNSANATEWASLQTSTFFLNFFSRAALIL